jgi:hypothetical protein
VLACGVPGVSRFGAERHGRGLSCTRPQPCPGCLGVKTRPSDDQQKDVARERTDEARHSQGRAPDSIPFAAAVNPSRTGRLAGSTRLAAVERQTRRAIRSSGPAR